MTLFLHLTVCEPQAQPYLVFEGDILILPNAGEGRMLAFIQSENSQR